MPSCVMEEANILTIVLKECSAAVNIKANDKLAFTIIGHCHIIIIVLNTAHP